MSDFVYGVDLSFHRLTRENARLMRLGDVKVVMQNLWTGTKQPPFRVENLRILQEEGFTEPGYALGGYAVVLSPAWGRTGRQHMEMARSGMPSDLWNVLRRVPVDVETEDVRVSDIRQAVDRLHDLGKPRDIYTNWNTWNNYLDVRNPQEFSDCDLWNANWDGSPDIDFTDLTFGPWSITDVIGEQWSGGTRIFGAFVDRNQFRADAFGLIDRVPPVPPTPPPPPTPEQLLGAEQVWGKIVEEFAKGNPLLTGTGLRPKAKFLLGL